MRSIAVSFCIFFFKQKTAYEMRISDWSSDVCSSDLLDLDVVDRVLDDLELPDLRNLGVEHIAEEGPGPAAVRVDQHVAGTAQDAGQHRQPAAARAGGADQIGRASCRERVCQDV